MKCLCTVGCFVKRGRTGSRPSHGAYSRRWRQQSRVDDAVGRPSAVALWAAVQQPEASRQQPGAVIVNEWAFPKILLFYNRSRDTTRRQLCLTERDGRDIDARRHYKTAAARRALCRASTRAPTLRARKQSALFTARLILSAPLVQVCARVPRAAAAAAAVAAAAAAAAVAAARRLGAARRRLEPALAKGGKVARRRKVHAPARAVDARAVEALVRPARVARAAFCVCLFCCCLLLGACEAGGAREEGPGGGACAMVMAWPALVFCVASRTPAPFAACLSNSTSALLSRVCCVAQVFE